MKFQSPIKPLEDRPAKTDGKRRCVVECAELPAFEATDLTAVRRAMSVAAPLALRQAWLPKEQAEFAPASVRIGWRGGDLVVFAELFDADIFSRATGPQQRTWELGDAFEILLQPEGQEFYVELHVTPENHRLQLRYEDRAMVEHVRDNGSFERALLPGDLFHSRAWIEAQSQQWFVYAAIPARSVSRNNSPLPGSRWRFSFSRYDYTRGCTRPVISSTSPHAEPDFHRRHEWGVLVFQSFTSLKCS